MSWAAEEFKDIDLGDRRLDKRGGGNAFDPIYLSQIIH